MAGPGCSRPPTSRRPLWRGLTGFVAVLMVCGGWLAPAPVSAQQFEFPKPPPQQPKTAAAIERAGQKQMLVQAREIDYDQVNGQVSAVGNVQIYYGGSALEADKVIYNQKTKRLHAEGNVRLTDEDGKITYGDIMDLSDDYRDGFVDSLRLDTPDRTRMAAARGDRTGGQFTVMHQGVYTACEPCKDNPKKPPLWQVKAARIIHDQGEKMVYFEDARLEFFGTPLVWMPYFSAPDPTVKRKTGVLAPSFSSSTIYGAAVAVPYYWALAPDYDATVVPTITTKQGPLLEGEYRQRFSNGQVTIRGAGIYQLDRSPFQRSDGTSTPGDRNFRGSIESAGRFTITDKWSWGWDALLVSDQTFLQDYNPRLSGYHVTDPFTAGASSGVSQIYLTGVGDRSYFDARSIYYYGFSEADTQGQIPVIHPVVDYNYTFDKPVLGGEVSIKSNLTSLSRSQADFDATNINAFNTGACAPTADSGVKTPTNCLLRGVPGTFTRFSAEAEWRRTITDRFGQQFKPFVMLRADAASSQVKNDPTLNGFMTPGNSDVVRGMPTVGLEYRYPFISVQSWGSQTVEPIAQIIARPNETQISKFPNEDAQTLVFDDSNLFRVNKFSGWDREEGGGRANYGLQYTAQFNHGGFVNALFGQSYQLFGANSYAQADNTYTGIDSGLDTRRSDYVARFAFQPNATYMFTSRFRFDHDSFSIKRSEYEARARYDRWSLGLLYGNYAAQPEIGLLDRREGILGSASYKFDTNWALMGSARYDLVANKFDQYRVGIGYIDDCVILGLNYMANYTYSGNATINHQIMLQLTLRTLGGTAVSQSVGTSGAN